MRKSAFIIWVLLASLGFAPRSTAQGVLAPLYLYTAGQGEITPFASGQMLTAGQVYDLQAIPDAGFVFSSWQPVNVFTFNEIMYNGDGTSNIVSSSSPSPVPDYTFQSALQFTMQPEELVLDVPGRSITEDSGWQANFVPVPEPSGIVLLVGGIAIIQFLKRIRKICLTVVCRGK